MEGERPLKDDRNDKEKQGSTADQPVDSESMKIESAENLVEENSTDMAEDEVVATQDTAEPEEAEGDAAQKALVERLTHELEDVKELVRRKQAEFENYRKRVERERLDFLKHASAEVVTEILPVLDNLERALMAPDTGDEDRLREGVEITYRQFRDILTKAGLKEVEALGEEFDPHVHEAVGRVETREHREGEVLEVYQKGYFFKDKLLRPALVNVAQRPSSDSEDQAGSSETEEDASENEQFQSDVTSG
jgi:molecular chaperone GrpE